MSELEKMKKGENYYALDAEIFELQNKASKMVKRYNESDDEVEKKDIIKKLFGKSSDMTNIAPGFKCDFGFNIFFNGLAIINYNCVFLDTAPINIGNAVFMGPGTCVSCASHPIIAEERNSGYLVSKSITIGDNVWIGANCTILGGVTIGKNSVIGASSVVTKDIPEGVIAVGNPCRVLRKISESDKINIDL